MAEFIGSPDYVAALEADVNKLAKEAGELRQKTKDLAMLVRRLAYAMPDGIKGTYIPVSERTNRP